MKIFKKFIFNKITLAITLMLSLISVCFFSTRTYAWGVIDVEGTLTLRSNNLLDEIQENYRYNPTTGNKISSNEYFCSQNLINVQNTPYDFNSLQGRFINLWVENKLTNGIYVIGYNNSRDFVKTISWEDVSVIHYKDNTFTYKIDSQENIQYITISCRKDAVSDSLPNIMVNTGSMPMPYEPPKLYNSIQYLNTYNEIERYVYYEEWRNNVHTNYCNYTNNGSLIAIKPNTIFPEASISIDLYNYLVPDTFYTFIVQTEEHTQAVLELVDNNQNVAYVRTNQSFKFTNKMHTKIYFGNLSADSYEMVKLLIIKTETLNSLYNTIDDKDFQIEQLQNNYNDLNNNFNTLTQNYLDLQNSYNRYISGNNFTNLFFTIAETPFTSFKTIWNVDFLGVNLAGFVTGILFIGLLIWVVKKIF